MKKLFTFLGYALFIFIKADAQTPKLHLQNGEIKDADNRTIILNGCVTITHHGNGLQLYTPGDYKRLKSWGANYQSIRLHAASIGADGSPTFPASYQVMDSMVSRAKQAGIYTVFKLTMYSGNPYNWEDLWLNNGSAQQDLINGWQTVWKRYINEPAVIGYDLVNEAEKGTLAVADSVFVCNYLTPVYQKLIDSLHHMDTSKFALIQPSVKGINMTTGDVSYHPYPCPINRSKVIYAPHFYVNINYPYNTSGYLSLLNRYLNESQLHNAPLLIGEYGIPWNKADDGNTIKENQHAITEKFAIKLFDSLKIGWSRPWFADDNAEVAGMPQFNWALIKGTNGLSGNEREFITNVFSRPYPKATAGDLLKYQFSPDNKVFEMTYGSNLSYGNTEIFTSKKRHYNDSLILQYNNNCFWLDTATGIFQTILNPDGLDPLNFSWNKEHEIITIKEWANKTNTIRLLNTSICTPLNVVNVNIARLRLYPNPADNILIVERSANIKESLTISNIQGQIVKTEILLEKVSRINLSNLVAGVYFVKIGNEYKKILKN